MLKEFKEFAMKGNVVDLAVGFILGGPFGTIVKSMVDDVLMPRIGLVLGGLDFSNLKIVLKDGDAAASRSRARSTTCRTDCSLARRSATSPKRFRSPPAPAPRRPEACRLEAEDAESRGCSAFRQD